MRRAVVAAVLAVAIGVNLAAFAAVLRRGWFTAGTPFDTLATVLLVVAPWVCGAAAVSVGRARPANRSAPALLTIGGLLAAWTVAIASSGAWTNYAALVFLPVRPLLFGLVVAWPFGRLTAPDRRWITAYGVSLALCWSGWVVLDPSPWGLGGRRFDNPLAPVDLKALAEPLVAIGGFVVMPAGAIVALVAVVRRHRRLAPAARRLARTATVGGVLACCGDPILVIVNHFLAPLTGGDDGRTALGGVVALFDLGRFVSVPVLLVASMRAAKRLAPERVRLVELRPGADRLQDVVAAGLGDPTAGLLYRGADGGWLDTEGNPAAPLRAGRARTVVETPVGEVAAVEYDEALQERPTLVELAVASVASALEHDRLAALARSQLREARAARRTIVEVEDAVRRRVERDLHDGAQQRLVGLALLSSLATRPGRNDETDTIASGVAEARRELRDLAAGDLPALLAERGLGTAISTLAATVPLDVLVQLDLPASLPEATAATAWFVVAESVANAVKHARATRLSVKGRVTGGVLSLSIEDDGVGGATIERGTGLAGLLARARDVGGKLRIESPSGGGTALHLEVPAVVP